MASSRPRDYPVGRGSVGAAVMTGSRRETESAAAQASMTRTCLTDTGELAGARGGGRGRSRREATVTARWGSPLASIRADAFRCRRGGKSLSRMRRVKDFR